MKIPSAQQNLVPNNTTPAVPIRTLLLDLLGLHQAYVHQWLDILYAQSPSYYKSKLPLVNQLASTEIMHTKKGKHVRVQDYSTQNCW